METLNPFCIYCNSSHTPGRACPPKPHLASSFKGVQSLEGDHPRKVFATGVIRQRRGITALRNKKGGVTLLRFSPKAA